MTAIRSPISPSRRRILVTSALPYANGQIHIGHLVEYIQTDIWTRALRMQGHEIHYVSADDTHGTAIMLRAEKEGIAPQTLIDRVWREHKRDFDAFGIAFDYYGSTNAAENRALSEQVYRALCDAGLIEAREIEQAYDPVAKMFLPDRFIKGGCPKCDAKDQYGDSCEICGATYQPTALISPYSVISGTTPTRKPSVHYFFRLSDPRCTAFLREWVSQLAQPEATNKMREWLGTSGEAKLADWDISRDAPYFGFEIPDTPGKYFYVWLDAPLGYYATFQKLCDQQARELTFNDWVKTGGGTELYHFIGKDILYFHTLFWPAMLEFSGYRTPTNVFAHGFLTVDGKKMSKSRGTFITAESYLKAGLNSEWLRYYFATKLNPSMDDIDLNWDDFIARVNSDLIGKYLNIASRTAGFLVKHFHARVEDKAMSDPLIIALRAVMRTVSAYYENRDYVRAIRQIMQEADKINAYIDAAQPWQQAKEASNHSAAATALHQVCSVSLEAFRLLTLALKPVLPKTSASVESFLNITPLTWSAIDHPLTADQPIHAYQHLMTRVEKKQVETLIAMNLSVHRPG